MIHHQNIRRLVPHEHGIQLLVHRIIICLTVIIPWIFIFYGNHYFRMFPVVHGSRLVQQRALIYGIQFQFFRHFNHRVRVILVLFQQRSAAGFLKQGIYDAALPGGNPRTPAVRQPKVCLHPGHKLLPGGASLCPGIFRSAENPILSRQNKRPVLHGTKVHLAVPLRKCHRLNVVRLSFRPFFKGKPGIVRICGIDPDVFPVGHDIVILRGHFSAFQDSAVLSV